MLDTLFNYINFTNCAVVVAFALLFAAGAKLFLKTRQWSIAVFTAGMGAVLLSHFLVFVAYQQFPVVFKQDLGIVPEQYRDATIWISIGLNAVGLVVSSLAFLFYAFRGAGHKNAT